jgi:uncharacterized protein
MHSLPDIQDLFLRGLLARELVEASALFRANHIGSTERFEIYRNNVLNNFRQTLADTFPAIVQIVGDEFFRHLATQYAYHVPSMSGDLGDFGVRFPDFVAAFPGTEPLPYLQDTARLEWALDRAFHAADLAQSHGALLHLQRLASVPPDRQGELRFVLHPSAQLIASPHPILAIWQLTQEDASRDALVDLDTGADWLLVLRALDFQPRIHRLTRGAFSLLEEIAKGADIASAFDSAIVLEPAFDLQAVLTEHLQLGTLVDFQLGDRPTRN